MTFYANAQTAPEEPEKETPEEEESSVDPYADEAEGETTYKCDNDHEFDEETAASHRFVCPDCGDDLIPSDLY